MIFYIETIILCPFLVFPILKFEPERTWNFKLYGEKRAELVYLPNWLSGMFEASLVFCKFGFQHSILPFVVLTNMSSDTKILPWKAWSDTKIGPLYEIQLCKKTQKCWGVQCSLIKYLATGMASMMNAYGSMEMQTYGRTSPICLIICLSQLL
jgi:hypothetical protein